MPKREATYSQIISPEDFCKINTEQHLYISGSDERIKNLIIEESKTRTVKEVVEIGCGPARILPFIGTIPGIKFTGIDHDAEFVAYARKKVQSTNIDVQVADAANFRKDTAVDIFYSQGVHHHIAKGKTY
ncbi:class I SAM-dependent methyltransferase [Pleurocapsales cyanobacterium LEGE 06147]|nr:class I SAM-dependent methyltransferase [Pleurocapsales cyanobacterium LEGE 06147]